MIHHAKCTAFALILAILVGLPAAAQEVRRAASFGPGTPIIGTCPSGSVLYNNSSAVGCLSVTGSAGSVVQSVSPTLVTPTLGAALATSINGLTITTSTGSLTIANAKTLTVNNSLTLAGTDATTITFPTTSATMARTDAGQTFTGSDIFSSAPTFSSITGSTQCLHVNTSGVVSGTGSDCGSGGGGTITAGTTPTSGITSGNFISTTSNLAADSGVAVASVAPKASPTFTGTVTFPDSSTHTSGGLGSVPFVGIGQAAPSTFALGVTGVAQTGASANGAVSIAQTWNTSGNPTAFSVAITNTAVGNGNTALLFNLLGGASGTTSMFKVDSFGDVTTAAQLTVGNVLNVSASGITGTNGAALNLSTGNQAGSTTPNNISLTSGSNTQASGTHPGGNVLVSGGSATGAGSTGGGGNIVLTPGTSVGGTPGSVAAGASAIATNATGGFLYIPAAAGAPTGTPAGISGYVPIYLDTTNNQLWLYLGGSWKQPKTPAAAATVTWQ